MTSDPSLNGGNGEQQQRDSRGRFVSGNRGGPGNPHTQKVNRLRSPLLRAVSVRDLRAIVKALVERGKKGDVYAAREVLDRTLGKAATYEALQLEERLAEP